MWRRTSVFQKFFEVIFIVTFRDFSIEFPPNKYVVYVIFFLIIIQSTNNRPVVLFSTGVPFSVETGIYVILVLVYFIFVFPEIWCSVTIFSTFVASALEEISLFLFLYPVFSAMTFSSGSCLSYFLFPPNSVFQNQIISFLRSLYAIFKMLTLQ